MARFLVTGGCGFIGSHVADELIRQGHQVRILDDLSTGKRANAPPQAELVIGDVTDRAVVGDCVDGMDGIFHLAAIASVERSHADWLGTHNVNLTGCLNVFDAARRGGAVGRRVVYASSAAVYGDSPALPLTEADLPRPTNAYGADKFACELHGRVASLLFRIPTVGLRLFNVYGPRQDPNSPYSGVISIFAQRLRQGAPLAIHGDGRQVRDFVAVADVVTFFMAAMAAPSATGGEVCNVCTGRGTTILDLARLMGEALGVAPEFQFRPPRAGDIRISIGDPTRATQVLGTTTTLTMRQGMRLALGDAGAAMGSAGNAA